MTTTASNSSSAPRAIEYLKGRGLSGEVAAHFAMGYAPEGWRSLASAFAHYDDPALEESGLVIVQGEPPDEKRYDRFRDRIMFPIRSVRGEVIGFGGRVLDHGEPQVPELPPRPRSSAKAASCMACSRPAQQSASRVMSWSSKATWTWWRSPNWGFRMPLPTLGTACTAEHVQKLFRFTDAVVFSFDGDAAGRRAAGRALEASLVHATDTRSVRFLFLPPEHDPDSYVREHGAASFAGCIEQAVPLSRQLIAIAQDGCDMATAEGRAPLSRFGASVVDRLA